MFGDYRGYLCKNFKIPDFVVDGIDFFARDNESLSTKNMLYVPEGFTLGHFALSDTAELVYECTDVYGQLLRAVSVSPQT